MLKLRANAVAGVALLLHHRHVFCVECRRLSRARQPRELSGCDWRRNGCGHWLMGQLPQDLEL